MDPTDELHAAIAGRYELLREIGRGGMAVVYLARDLKHERQVAIKVLPPELSTSVGAERFLREIRTAAQLSHPNILPLHDSIAVDGVRCYVMPFVEGESLRDRLQRERQLGIEEAVDIARQVAAGLDYAHSHGVVHRDIKPENILLVGEQAMIADFGLARALYSASSAPVTASGIAVGTPAYMSPEQAAADQTIDGRADVYSLGCLFYEMVAGMPPFRGATAGAVLVAHATRTPPSLCAERQTCPASMDAAVQRALAKVPADRFRTAGAFAHALTSWRSSGAPGLHEHPRRRWVAIGSAAAVVAAAVVAAPRVVERVQAARVPVDSSRVLILPFTGTGGRVITPALARQQLTSAFARWRDLRVVDLPDSEAVQDASPRDLRRLARHHGAGMYVLATTSALGDSVELRATLYDSGARPVRQTALRLPDHASAGGDRYRVLATTLLRAADAPPGDEAAEGGPGTDRVGAWRAFTRGQQARAAWNLEAAEREFRQATSLDPSFAGAHLWLAQVIAWQRPNRTKEWSEQIGRVVPLPGRLSVRDSLLAAGLAMLAAGRYPAACSAYRALQRRTPESDLPWYGIAYCLGLDPIVEPAPGSPSRWRFRGSPTAAIAALDSAIAHADGAPTFAFDMLGMLVVADPSRLRPGSTADGATRFFAVPSIVGDTVAVIPYPAAGIAGRAHPGSATRTAALQRNARRLAEVYRVWTQRAPRAGRAWSALAHAQELMGDPAAPATLHRALTLTAGGPDRLRLGVRGIRLQVKQGRFADARRAADSLLRTPEAGDEELAGALAGVAALIGDVPRAAALLARAAHAEPHAVFQTGATTPPAVVPAATAFLATAASGACPDTLRSYLSLIDRMLVQYAPEQQRDELRRATLGRATSLAVPCLGPAAAMPLSKGDRLVRMQQYLAAGDMRALRAAFDTVRSVRLGMRAGDVSLDQTYQEAWLLLMMRDTAAAVQYLETPLTALPTMSTRLLDDVATAAAVGRAFALRAELAAAVGDADGARRHARQVLALWSGGSSELQPTVRRMQSLSQGTSR